MYIISMEASILYIYIDIDTHTYIIRLYIHTTNLHMLHIQP